jgi:DnaJ-class molecular chaperone
MTDDAVSNTDDYPTCEVPDCGCDLEFEDCWSCGGEGGEFPYESFPLEYLPDEWESCQECSGRGTISRCESHGRIDNEWDRGKAKV